MGEGRGGAEGPALWHRPSSAAPRPHPTPAGKFLDEQLNISEVVGQATAKLDETLSGAAAGVAAGVAAARVQGEAAASQAQGWWETGVAHYRATEDRAFGQLREWVALAGEHREAAAAGGVLAAAVLLPGPRRFLLRRTLGRLRSEEAAFRSAERHYASVTEAVEAQARDVKKLEERLGLAAEEYRRGLTKLRGTAGELQSLTHRVYDTQKTAQRARVVAARGVCVCEGVEGEAGEGAWRGLRGESERTRTPLPPLTLPHPPHPLCRSAG